MATRDESTFIGVADEEITTVRSSPESWMCNKIGGIPAYSPSVEAESPSPVCLVCRQCMSFALQLYCPLYGVTDSRVLYVYVCVSVGCQNLCHCWRVFRSQRANEHNDHEMEENSTNQLADKWGECSDEWGDEAENLASTIGWNIGHKSHEYSTSSAWIENTESANRQNHHDQNKNQSTNANISTSDFECQENDAQLSKTFAIACKVNNNHKADIFPYDTEINQEMETVSCELYNKQVSTCDDRHMSNSDQSRVVFKAFYIAVYPEESNITQTDVHVKTLLKDYEYLNGAVDRMDHIGSGRSKESYEKADISHGDKVFYKFLSRLSSCPQQCLRYQWNGTPLLSSPLRTVSPPLCRNCGGDCVFEIQLTPALISALVPVAQIDVTLDFSTVLVFTCKKSCWSKERVFSEEMVIVQPDPYHQILPK